MRWVPAGSSTPTNQVAVAKVDAGTPGARPADIVRLDAPAAVRIRRVQQLRTPGHVPLTGEVSRSTAC